MSRDRLIGGVGKGLAGLFLALAVYAIAVVAMHPRFIYPFSPEPAAFDGFETVSVPVPGADPLPVLVHDAGEGATLILYFMGNAGSLAAFGPELAPHRDAGRSVVAMTYRGGGGVPGVPSERRLKDDAVAVADWAAARFDAPFTLVHGYSLGSGLALHVAAQRPVDRVILTAPFARLCTLMARATWLPACLLPFVQRWDNLADVPRVQARVLILHGTRDRVVPFAEGRRLGLAFPEGQVALVPFDEDHDSIVTRPGYLDIIGLGVRATELGLP